MATVRRGDATVDISEYEPLERAVLILNEIDRLKAEEELKKIQHGHDFNPIDYCCRYCGMTQIQYVDNPSLCRSLPDAYVRR